MSSSKKSQVWLHFTPENEEKKVKCLYCGRELSVANKSTCSLIRHINKKHPTQHQIYISTPKQEETDEPEYSSPESSPSPKRRVKAQRETELTDFDEHQYSTPERTPAKRKTRRVVYLTAKPDSHRNSKNKASFTNNDVDEKQEMDECELYGQLLIKKLRKLNEQQREQAMHEIDNIMYKIKMQNHSEATVFVVSSQGNHHGTDDGQAIEAYQQNPLT